jgi:hypothetical protein
MEKKTLKDKITEWNIMYPLDYWWRSKHKIAYGSKAHLDANQLDIAFEYFEEKMYFDLTKPNENSVKEDMRLLNPYIPGSKDFMHKQDNSLKLTKKDNARLDDITSLEDIQINDDGSIKL